MTAKKIISLLLMLLLACTAVYGFATVDRPAPPQAATGASTKKLRLTRTSFLPIIKPLQRRKEVFP